MQGTQTPPAHVQLSLVEFMYLVFTRMPGEGYRRRIRSLLYLRVVFRARINSLVCCLFLSMTSVIKIPAPEHAIADADTPLPPPPHQKNKIKIKMSRD